MTTPQEPGNDNSPPPPLSPPPVAPQRTTQISNFPSQGAPGITAADGAALMGAISALPEKIVNGIREATQAATPPAPVQPPAKPVDSETSSKASVQDSTRPGKPQSLRDWWFS